VVFVHGLTGNNSSFVTIPNYLATYFDVELLRPDLGWARVYNEQAQALQTALGNRTSAAAISHSNGSVVTRVYFSNYGTGTRINRHLSVGGLHRGAALARNVRNGNVEVWMGQVVWSVVDAFQTFSNLDLDFYESPFAAEVQGLAYGFLDAFFVSRSTVSIIALIGYLGFILDQAVPVLSQMEPGSSTLQALNSTSGLSAEGAITTAQGRVSIATRTNPEQLPWTLFFTRPDAATVRATVKFFEAFALSMYFYYLGAPDPVLRANAPKWLQMFWALELIPAAWANQIGALRAFVWSPTSLYYFVDIEYSDGVLTWSTQDYVGGTRLIRIPRTEDITHLEQRAHGKVVERVDDVARNDFRLPVRQPPPPPPDLPVVGISGPTSVVAFSQNTWTASVSGGGGGYSYDWYRSDAGGPFSFVGTGSTYTGSFASCEGGALRLEVTANNGSGTGQVSIGVTGPGGGACVEG
jgi:hypothetical protein